MIWTNDPPPFGVWAYSTSEGLFRINRKSGDCYLEIAKCYCFEKRRIETGTVFTVFVNGPFIYPLPDPTKGIQ